MIVRNLWKLVILLSAISLFSCSSSSSQESVGHTIMEAIRNEDPKRLQRSYLLLKKRWASTIRIRKKAPTEPLSIKGMTGRSF